MSCMIAQISGGNPTREMFPVLLVRMEQLQKVGASAMTELLRRSGTKQSDSAVQYIGAALKPDGTPFYLTTLAPPMHGSDFVGRWAGAFFAPFGVANLVGVVEAEVKEAHGPISLRTKAALVRDAGGNPPKDDFDVGKPYVSAEWEVQGSQATRLNKSALIGAVNIIDPGPHDPADMRRCIMLHAPQRCFGEPSAVIAMQCGVAAACLIESIC